MKPMFQLALVALTCAAAPAIAQQPRVEAGAAVASSPGRGEMISTVRITATVMAVDKATRTVTFKGKDGKEIPIVAGPEVRNFDQIKVGSEVTVAYVEALAIELKKGGGTPVGRVETTAGGRAEASAQPGGAAGRKITANGDVIALDAAKQVVTVRGSQRTIDMRVPDAKQFKMIAMGDQIQFTYTEAVAVSLEPAKK